MLPNVFKSPDREDSSLLKQNWPFVAKRRRDAPTNRIFGDVRSFTVRQEPGKCSGYDVYATRRKTEKVWFDSQ